MGSSTFPLGAFPALVPDLDRVAGLTTLELGALTAAFGFARMLVDVPVGLVVARRLRPALLGAPLLLACGILAIGSGGPFPVLLLGRLLMGVAHALGMVAWLTVLLRQQTGALGTSLNAFELSAMLGMLGGASVMGALPTTLPWNVALLLACVPQLVGVAVAPVLARSLPAPSTAFPAAGPLTVPPPRAREHRPLVPLAFMAGAALAVTYSTIELFMLPLRGSRQLGLDRTGVARLLMLAQVCDIAALLPVGMTADRVGPGRLLGLVLLAFAGAAVLVSFGGLTAMTAGAALLGVGMAGWMLPLAVLRRQTAPAQIPWRTALYRVGVDGGLFLGPFVAGVLGARAWMLVVTLALVLVILGLALLGRSGRAVPE